MTETSAPDVRLVVALLREQAPAALAALTLRATATSGSSNWVFRLGEEHAVRLPRSDEYADDLRKETQWLPLLAPALSVAVPDIVFAGEASALFPRPWSVVSWVRGENPHHLDADAQARLARDLGGFMRELHDADTFGEASGSELWGYRCGEPVTDRIDGWAESAATELADVFDVDQVREAWRRLREVPPPTHEPCWVHTDLSTENILVRENGALAGVIDFGALGIGDRSIDLLYAWELFEEPVRELLRTAAGIDGATWRRARAWAFVGPGLLTIAHYRESMPERTARLTRMVAAVAAEVGISLR